MIGDPLAVEHARVVAGTGYDLCYAGPCGRPILFRESDLEEDPLAAYLLLAHDVFEAEAVEIVACAIP